MQSKIKEFTENGKNLFLVRPVDFLDLVFYGNRLVRAYNHKLNKEYRGKNLDVFTEDYDLFNRYYRQALKDLNEYRSDIRYRMSRETASKPVKRTSPVTESSGYVCVVGHRPIARASNLIDARKAAVRYAKTDFVGIIEIYRGAEYVGKVYMQYGTTAIFETRTYARAVRSDGTLF